MSEPPIRRLESFPQTEWTLVNVAGQHDGPVRRAALAKLLSRYLGPMKSHLVLRLGVTPDRADDLLQGFLLDQVLERHLIRRAERQKGKFRSFLLVALHRYVANERRGHAAQKRGGGGAKTRSLGDGVDPVSREPDPTETFDLPWARAVVDEALARMKGDCVLYNRPDIWGVFEQRLVTPTYEGTAPVDYAELVRQFQLDSVPQASNVLITAKRMFARALRAVVAEYEPDERAVESEIAGLQEILARHSSRA